MEIATIIAVIGVLVALTNIIVEVAKKATWDKLPTNILALLVAIALTLASGFAYCQIRRFPSPGTSSWPLWWPASWWRTPPCSDSISSRKL